MKGGAGMDSGTILRSAVFLSDGRSDAPAVVSASLIRDLPPDRLVAVEEMWGPQRGIIREALAQVGGSMQHAHWDWRDKIDRAVKGQLLLSAIECDGEIQGLIAVAARARFACLLPGAQALYVDYIETAPWNLRTAVSPPRYEGVGTLLLADALFRSRELGHDGRIGLHSLPSAVDYYRHRCGMTDLGEDPAYYDLRYFEYTAEEATAWLTRIEVSR